MNSAGTGFANCRPRRVAVGCGLGAAVFAVWVAWPRHADLRRFDPEHAAALETRLWRSYYEHRRLALARDLYLLSRDEYGFSPWSALRLAAHAGRAAVLFQRSRTRAEAQAARPELRQYFAVIRADTDSEFDPDQAAAQELEWWQLRREQRTWREYADAIARVDATVYQVPIVRLQPSARTRAEMMDYRDRHRDGGMTDADWERVRAGLAQAWRELKQAVADAEVPHAP